MTAVQAVPAADPERRLRTLLDPAAVDIVHPPDDGGVVVATGRIAGVDVVAFGTDPRVQGGAIGGVGSDRIIAATRAAVARRVPIVGVWHSGGARLRDDIDSLDGAGRMFTAFTRASGIVPQISVVLGPAAGAAAYGPGLTDLVIMSRAARLFVTGPSVLRSVTGQDVTMEELGGSFVHGHHSGVAHVCADADADALGQARTVVELLGRARSPSVDPPVRGRDVGALLPAQPRRAYDVRPLIRALLDEGPTGDGLFELQPHWAANIVIGLGRLHGATVGVVANNPIRKAGCLDATAAEKAARFVRMCDCLGVPLLVLVDVPGYLPGVEEEWNGVVRRGAKLLHAFARCAVPRVTLVTRKAYGGAYIAMNSRALGATAVFAWPGAEIAVMGSEAAVGVLHRHTIARAEPAERDAVRKALAQRHRDEARGLDAALAAGVVDAIVDPAATRARLIEAFAIAPRGRGSGANIPL